MRVLVGVAILLGAGLAAAEETPAYKRFRRIAAEMAEFGMPVDVGRVRLAVREPTQEEFLRGLAASGTGRTDPATGRDPGVGVVMGTYDTSERRIRILALGSLMWSEGDALVAHATHELVVVSVVADAAIEMGLFQTADAVFKTRGSEPSPRTGQSLSVASIAVEGLIGDSFFERMMRELFEGVGVGNFPRLGAVGQVAIGEQQHRRHVLEGDATGLHGDFETVGGR